MSDKVEDVPIDVEPVDATTPVPEERVEETVEKKVEDKPEEKTEEKTEKSESGKDAEQKEKEEKEEEEEEEAAPPPLPSRKSTSPEIEKPKENPMLKELKEAFPGVEEKYVKAVLIASQGQLDPAFNALLFLSDPGFEKEASLPTRPVHAPVQAHPETPRQLSQLEQDELLARQLDEKYNKHGRSSGERAARERRIRRRQRDYERRYGQGAQAPEGTEDYDEDSDDMFSTFVEKDLPQIRENLNRNIQETGKKISTWFSGIKKNLTEEGSDEQSAGGRSSQSKFNSFGDRYGDDSVDDQTKLQNAGITLENEDLDFGSDDDVPPQLPSRAKSKHVVAETTYIDTPEQARTKHNRSPLKTVAPQAISPTKTKAKATTETTPETASKDPGPITLEDNDIVVDSDLDI
ncbi:Ubiquitin-binding protein CUE5 [Kluyveromyces marxianus]|nr:ubiquitin-binding protein cue5 [Kluyveromyces marxianus]